MQIYVCIYIYVYICRPECPAQQLHGRARLLRRVAGEEAVVLHQVHHPSQQTCPGGSGHPDPVESSGIQWNMEISLKDLMIESIDYEHLYGSSIY